MQLRTQRTIDNYVGRIGIAALRPAAIALGAILRRDHRLEVGREIVWVKLLGGGSLLLALPMLLGIRRAHPGTRMVLITTRAVKPFAELMGVFDEYRVIDDRGLARLMGSSVRTLFQTLRADCIVDLEVHSRLTTVFTTLTLARNRIAFWLEDIFWRRGLASHLIFFNRSSASFHFYDRVADLVGVPIAGRAECRSAVVAAAGVTPRGRRDDRTVCVGFACSELGRERMLSPEQWARAFERYRRPEHARFLFLGGPGDRPAAEAIIAAVRAAFPELEFRNCCGEMTLAESVQALFDAREFWGIDSSLLHLARISGARSVSFWGPTDPATRLRPEPALDERTIYRKIACSPCVHTSEEPPCHGDNRCIQALFDDSVPAPVSWTPIEYPPARHALS